MFDEILLAKSEVSGDGVLIMFLKRMVVVILIGLLILFSIYTFFLQDVLFIILDVDTIQY